MANYRRRRSRSAFIDRVLDLCWGAWAELGVSGWARTHADWAIDPEPLIIFTAAIGNEDPRLRDEATDWCIHYWRYVSRVRLRNLRNRDADEEFHDAWGEFAGTVNAHASVTWPGASEGRLSYRTTGRSQLRALSEPSLVYLRMRSMFGLSARTEILRHFLFHRYDWSTTSQLARLTAYTKRNVAEECEALERADVLALRVEGNRFYYSLARRKALREFVGDMADVRPHWPFLFNVITSVLDLDSSSRSLSRDALDVEARRTIRDIAEYLEVLELEPPPLRKGAGAADDVLTWAADFLETLGEGRWPSTRSRPIQRVRAVP
jgi:DNA-binding transcriptional ArsR family regulator